MASSRPVGIVTGAASGMGLATTKYLITAGWNVTLFDFNGIEATSIANDLGEQALAIQGNAVVYEDQAKAFAATWKRWGRLDLVHANAGFGDRVDFCQPVGEDEKGIPAIPDILTVEVSLLGSIWTTHLALHFFRKNASQAGKLIYTSSEAGLYESPEMPLYSAAKHGIVGLTRALGARFRESNEPITVNAICPGMVPTRLLGETISNAVPPEMLTPLSTIIHAFEHIIKDDTLNGQAIECSGTEFAARPVLPFLNAVAEFTGTKQVRKYLDTAAAKEHVANRTRYLQKFTGIERK